MAKIRTIDIHKAFKIILGINYRYRWLDVYISPNETMWMTAVQFRNDPERNWHPRVIHYYPSLEKVTILNCIGDPKPKVIDGRIILAMAEMRAQSPQPTFTA
jgi:hypothetical protein